MNTRLILRLSCVLLLITTVWLGSVTNTYADTWRGTAPFCKGQCLPGEVQVGTSKNGDGGHCVTGKKVLCKNNQSQCNAKQTNTKCYGAVQICDNGYYEIIPQTMQQVWHSCNKYACGACVGLPCWETKIVMRRNVYTVSVSDNAATARIREWFFSVVAKLAGKVCKLERRKHWGCST